MKYLWIVIAPMLLAACTAAQAQERGASTELGFWDIQEQRPTDATMSTPFIDLSDLGEAPELVNEVWLNTDQPLRLADLRGSVVLLEMWTFG